MKLFKKKLTLLFRSREGASIMEFALTIGMMAVLAATAAPKLSHVSEEAKFRKSMDEIEKISKQALNYFQEMAVKEGRGKFPGQSKYDSKVGGHESVDDLYSDLLGSDEVINENGVIVTPAVMPTFRNFNSADGSHWVSVFGSENYTNNVTFNSDYPDVDTLWTPLFGNELLESPFQDGHYVYQVLAGSGAGSQAEAPTLFIADLENPSQLHLILKP